MKRRLWVGVIAGVALLAACSGAGSEAPASDDLAQAGNRASASEDGSAGAAGSESTGAAGSAAVDCSSVEDQSGEPVAVRVVNDTAGTLYLGEEQQGCSPSRNWRFELRNAAGQRLGSVGSCLRCRDATVTGTGGCPSICLRQSALSLSPGEHADFEWDGLFGMNVALPEQCILPGPGPIHSSECARATRVPSGAYTVTIRAGATLKCEEECRPCRAREAGGCETANALVEKLDREISADIELEGGPGYGLKGPIELVFRD